MNQLHWRMPSGFFRKLKWQIKLRIAKLRIRTLVVFCKPPYRVVVGSGDTGFDGWINTDYPALDICSQSSVRSYFRENSVKSILAEHVWEHLNHDQAKRALSNCKWMLQKNGYLRIAVPDGAHPDPAYIDMVRPGGSGLGSEDHKVLYTLRSLSELIEEVGLKAQPLEWFDEAGKFHFNNWHQEDGAVSRSIRYDKRNIGGAPNFTSLIIDVIKLN